MTTLSASHKGTARASPGRRAAGWLTLAASPTFALMAAIAAKVASPVSLCSSGPDMPPIVGMTAMYLSMSLFHLSPWMKLASARPWARSPTTTKGDRP